MANNRNHRTPRRFRGIELCLIPLAACASSGAQIANPSDGGASTPSVSLVLATASTAVDPIVTLEATPETTTSPLDRFHATFTLDKTTVAAGSNLTYTGICLFFGGMPSEPLVHLGLSKFEPGGPITLYGDDDPIDPAGHGEWVITLPIPRDAPPGHYVAGMSCRYDDVQFDESQEIQVEVTPAEGPDPSLTTVSLPDSG